MKKIILSLSVIVFVGALVIGATGAFFSDTETSTGNTFTAGAIDLKIDSEQHYNGNTCTLVAGSDTDTTEDDVYQWTGEAAYPVVGEECTGTWPLTDLTDNFVAVHKFFDFNDLKPGDFGENTISLHIENNDAYMCAAIVNVGEGENGMTEPESQVDNDEDGELDEALNFFAWVDEGVTPGFGDDEDSEGDNIFQEGEPILGSANAADLVDQAWALAEGGDDPIAAGTTGYIGLAWCVGTFTQGGECNGTNVGNESQTDSWFTDLAFYVTQARNNDEFRCSMDLFQNGNEQEQDLTWVHTDGDDFPDNFHDDNEANNQPYVTWEINGDQITFTFHNPTNINSPFPFEYRFEGDASHPEPGITGVTIPSGPYSGQEWGEFYTFVSVPKQSTSQLVVTADQTDKVQIRLVIGPERDYDFGWLTFETVPTP